MPWEHARYCGLGMDAIVIVCSRNTNIIMVWAWMPWLSVCSRNTSFIMVWAWTRDSMLSEHERYYGLGMGALFIVFSVCSRNTNIITVWEWMRDSMLSEHGRYHGLGMDSLVIVCSRNTNVLIVWEWMHLLSYALETRTLSWFGHGCTSNRTLAEHERSYGLEMDALVIVCSRNTNVIMAWAWSHYFWYAFGTQTLLWFGHGCTIYRMLCYRTLSEHEHYYGFGMDAR